ncbi:MAG: L,D-transpeptidase family protein [Jatrophihabitantaceae bacterium]
MAGLTGTASQLLTVTAPAWGATQATLQAWDRIGASWQRHGDSVPAWLGQAGMSRQASEGFTGSPAGSFTLTQAFGNYPDPGTALPYFQAGRDDWWSGDSSSPTYNSHQRCPATSCPFRTGLSENLHDAGAVYGYAVAIDYNTAPAIPGRGSAFFLHVSQQQPTAGCVSIDQDALVQILRWLNPARHPRIIMGVG